MVGVWCNQVQSFKCSIVSLFSYYLEVCTIHNDDAFIQTKKDYTVDLKTEWRFTLGNVYITFRILRFLKEIVRSIFKNM